MEKTAVGSEGTTFLGRLEGIYIADRRREDVRPLEQVEAIPGSGLAGDRYCLDQGTFSKPGSPDREVTLIEMEAIEALARECDIILFAGQARRNLATRGVPLNHLVGQDFEIGDVVLRGLRLCEPCTHLQSLTVKGVLEGLKHRGGLRAQILQGGVLRQGDPVRPVDGKCS